MSRLIILIISSVIVIAAILSLTVFKEKIKSSFYIVHMESDDRIKGMNIDQIIAKLNIQKGDLIADIVAGSGLFSRKFSLSVTSEGRVYSVDINKELLKHIDRANLKDKIQNIRTVLANEDDPKIPEPVNLIFICDTLHYIDDQEKYAMKMVGYLKKNGKIAVISFIKNWPPMSNKFTDKDLSAWMEKSGLKLIHYYDDLIQDQYLAIYEKK